MPLPNEFILCPSLLSADQLNIESEARNAELCGADRHHFDVMDGHYVPNLTFGLPLLESLKKKSALPLDVHLMITNPDQTALDYVKAGADFLSFHIEIAQHPHRLASAIRSAGAKAGIAINPGTSLEALWPMLPYIDFVNVMSISPGFSGQAFLPESVARIKLISQKIHEAGKEAEILIQVDGGVNLITAPAILGAGARILVTGNYFYLAPDRRQAVAALRALKY